MFELQTKGMTPEQREEWWRREGHDAMCTRANPGQAEIPNLRYKSIASWMEMCTARLKKPSPNAKQWYRQGGFVA